LSPFTVAKGLNCCIVLGEILWIEDAELYNELGWIVRLYNTIDLLWRGEAKPESDPVTRDFTEAAENSAGISSNQAGNVQDSTELEMYTIDIDERSIAMTSESTISSGKVCGESSGDNVQSLQSLSRSLPLRNPSSTSPQPKSDGHMQRAVVWDKLASAIKSHVSITRNAGKPMTNDQPR